MQDVVETTKAPRAIGPYSQAVKVAPAGFTLEDVVKTTIYLKDMADFASVSYMPHASRR